jgi:hypothetical protein
MRLKNLNWDENTLIWRKYANCHIAGGGDMTRARDKLRLKGQEVIINEVRVKRAQKKVAFNPNSKFVRI